MKSPIAAPSRRNSGFEATLNSTVRPAARSSSAFEPRDLLRVDVGADHPHAELGEARAGDEADIARADHSDVHERLPSGDGSAKWEIVSRNPSRRSTDGW